MIIYEEFRVIAIPDNSTDRAVKRALMLRLSETVQEDEIRIAVDHRLTSSTSNWDLLLCCFRKKITNKPQI
jgi:hypothetical protein